MNLFPVCNIECCNRKWDQKTLELGQPVYNCFSMIGPTPGVECTEDYCPAGYKDKPHLMNTLHLNLIKKWFGMIKSGEKKEEYREMTDYWKIRMNNVMKKNVETITFSNGYKKNRPQFVIELSYISIRTGLIEWGAEKDQVYFVLHLGRIL